MKNTEIRHALEAELLMLGKTEKAFSQSEFSRYYHCLLRLFDIDKLSVFGQEKIYTATYGDITDFISEFSDYISPLIEILGNKIIFKTALSRRTKVLFSPRLMEIALGCMLSVFLGQNKNLYISVFNTNTHLVVSTKGKFIHKEKSTLNCLKKIAELHSGRVIYIFCDNHIKIALIFPLCPQFTPMRYIPCSTTLCRLCRI